METPQNSFILYTDSVEEVQLLTMEQRGLLLTTAFCYVNSLTLPELDQATSVLWHTWKKNIDRNAQKWEETRQRRSAAGRKGGLAAHRQSTATASNSKPSSAPEAVTDTDTVTGTVTDTVTVKEKGSALASPSEAINSYSIAFPMKSGSDYVVTSDEFENYVQSYPMLDVPQVFQKVLAWLEANPSRQKTAEMMPRFLTNWLEGDAKKAMRKEAYPDEGNTDKADFSSLDHFGTVL